MPPLDPGHQAEFGTVASWTAAALATLDDDSLIAGACRGSASPAALAWLAECLGLQPRQRLLDVGSGLGGPAAWAAARYGVVPVAVEPMEEAARGGRAIFGLDSAAATATALPLRDASFDVGWILGVLDTLPSAADALAEARRVLSDQGRLGLLAYVAQRPLDAADLPSGNRFQSIDELVADAAGAGFALIDRVDASTLPPAPIDWQVRQERLDRLVTERHGRDPRHREAREQADRFAGLLASGHVGASLLHLVCV